MGKKDWYLQVCHGGRRRLRYVGGREAAFAVKQDIETEIASGSSRPMKLTVAAKQAGAPGRTRTPDPLLRRQLLYPPELQARIRR